MCQRLLFALLLSACTMCAHAQFTNVTTATGIAVPITFTARGAAWADFDGDNDLDLMAPGGYSQDIVLWVNDGTGFFTPQVVVGGSSVLVYPRACIAADIDNDGDQDAYICVANNNVNFMLINQGNGTFVDEAAARGVALANVDSHSASFGDYDRDGWLDLYIAPHYVPNAPGTPPDHVLLRNTGDGYFTDVTTAANAAAPGYGFAAIWHDFDGDMWPDIVCSNDLGESSGAPACSLLRNNRNGTFTDISPLINANAAMDGMGVSVADIDNDGDWDMFQTNIATGHVLFVWDDAAGQFDFQGNWQQVAVNYGLLPPYLLGWGCEFADYNNDGFEDLLVMHQTASNVLFENNAGTGFTDVSAAQNIPAAVPGPFSATWVDYDNDGDLDIYDTGWLTSSQVAQNQGNGNNWLKLKLVGTISNRDGIGATVTATSASYSQRRYVHSGEGYISDGDRRVHFGIGTDPQVDLLEIRWPSGTVQYLENVAPQQILTVVESGFNTGSSTLTPGSLNTITLDLPEDGGLSYLVGMAGLVNGEYYLSDGRAVRVNVNDPILALSIAPGNPFLYGFDGVVPPSGTPSVYFSIPNLPLSGLDFHLIGVTISGSFPSAIKSIVGPHTFTIQ